LGGREGFPTFFGQTISRGKVVEDAGAVTVLEVINPAATVEWFTSNARAAAATEAWVATARRYRRSLQSRLCITA
jgi:hypothetical protein